MAKKTKKKAVKKQGPEEGLAYFTVRSLERAVKKGTKNKAEIAKKLAGYTVKEFEGWVVKEHADGSYERIVKVEKVERPSTLVLD